MSHFSRTSRNTPQRNQTKQQQSVESSTNPSQLNSNITESTNKSGYVYRPPVKIARTNPLPEKQSIQQVKKQQKKLPVKVEPIKAVSYVKKTNNQTIKQTIITTTVRVQQVEQVVQQQKPVVKPISRLLVNRKDPLQTLGLIAPKKQEPIKQDKIIKNQQTVNSPVNNSKNIQPQQVITSKIETKNTVTVNVTSSGVQNRMEQLKAISEKPNTSQMLNLDLKKPPNYSYPQKISRRGPQTAQKVEKVSQNKIQQEQLRQQTPKFNRIPADQKPKPANVSAFSYQRRNIEKPGNIQSTQPVSISLTQPIQSQSSENIRQPPSQNKVEINQLTKTSPIQQSPIKKTPLSHTTRYASKTQTPKQQKVSQPQQLQKLQIKRSPIIQYTLHKIFKQKLSDNFDQIISFSKNLKQTKRNQKLITLFEYSLMKFVKNYQKALVRTVFQPIKSIHCKNVKIQLNKSIDPKVANQLTQNRNNCVGKVLQNIIPSSTTLSRLAWNQLKLNFNQNKSKKIKLQTATKILTGLESQKLRQCLKLIDQFSHSKNQYKMIILGRFSQISHSFKKSLLRQSLNKISLYKLKQMSSSIKPVQVTKQASKSNLENITLSPKQNDLLAQNQISNQIKQNIAELQKKLTALKSKAPQQLSQGELRQSIKNLKQQKNMLSEQIKQKKKAEQQLKQKINLLNKKACAPHEQLSSLSENKTQNDESTLSLLHQIYMRVYKQPQEQCTNQQNIESLNAIHRVDQNKISRELVSKWLSIQQNISLKHQINLYEGNYSEQNALNKRQAYRQLVEQNQIIKKFIRSYIKERYMWEQVKEYVAAVINE